MNKEFEFLLYKAEQEDISVNALVKDETIWLTQKAMAELFDCSSDNISLHLKNIFAEGELDKNSVTEKISATASDGKNYLTQFYNLDAIISIGYRVNSIQATRFRQWATAVLKEYIIKGFTMDDDRLKQIGGGGYWKELLDRIRDIRSSEKVLYRQVLDLYATAVDYNPHSDTSVEFFKIVQNKLHYAAHGQTAAEVIYHRADADQPFMGLTTFAGNQPTLRDVRIAKNYLKEDEMKVLNNLVSGYFDFAEIQAMKRRPMYMADYITQLDNILLSTGEPLLTDAGSVSHHQAMAKAELEYRKFQVRTLSPVEEAYMETIKTLAAKTKKKP